VNIGNALMRINVGHIQTTAVTYTAFSAASAPSTTSLSKTVAESNPTLTWSRCK
jgi:hypothetical protein